MLEVKNLQKVYPNGVEALDGINLCFPDKGLVFLVGNSGSGKSTLLNILGGIDDKTGGEIFFDGKKVTSKNIEYYRRDKVSFVFQDFQLLYDLSVADNVALAKELVGGRVERADIEKVLESVGLSECIDRKANELSGGQMQRVAIARGLMKEGATILADEPTGNLDKKNSAKVFQLLKQISSERLVIVVSHDTASAEKYADVIIAIEDGRIISENEKVTLDRTVKNEGFNTYKRKGLSLKKTAMLSKWSLGKKPVKQIFAALIIILSIALCSSGYALLTLTEEGIDAELLKKHNENSLVQVGVKDFHINGKHLSTNEIKRIEENADINALRVVRKSCFDQSKVYVNDGSSARKAWKTENFWCTNAVVFADDVEELGYKLIEGRSATAEFEVVVPQIYADNIISNGYLQTNPYPMVTNTGVFASNANQLEESIRGYKDLIGKPFYFDTAEYKYTIVGIYDENSTLPERFRIMPMDKRNIGAGYLDISENESLEWISNYSFDKMVIMSEKNSSSFFTTNHGGSFSDSSSVKNYNIRFYNDGKESAPMTSIAFNPKLPFLSEELKGSGLKEGEVFLADVFENSREIGGKITAHVEYGGEFLKKSEKKEYTIKGFYKTNGLLKTTSSPGVYNEGYLGVETIDFSMRTSIVVSQEEHVQLDMENTWSSFMFNGKILQNYVHSVRAICNEVNEIVLEKYRENRNLSASNFLFEAKENLGGEAHILILSKKFIAIPFFVVGFVLLVVLLCFIFSLNVEKKEKEIAVLKSLGATRADVSKIFIFQSGVLAIIQFVLGLCLTLGGFAILNNSIYKSTGYVWNVALPYTFDNFLVVLLVVATSVALAVLWQIRRIFKKSTMKTLRE